MMALIHGAGWAASGLAMVGALYAIAAALLTQRFFARTRLIGDAPAVTLLKPLHGDEPGLAANLESFCRQDYAGPIQLLLGVQAETDSAIAVVRALQQAHPDLDIQLVIDPRVHAANCKIGNVTNLAAQARHDILVLSDSDIAVPPDYLRQVVAHLDRDGVGAVTCLYTGQGSGLWSHLSAMAISYQFLPNAILGSSIGLASPCFGSTIALRAETLKAIGGFEAFADTLADDYEIGRAVRALGLRMAMPAMAVSHRCTEATAGELLEHELRWGLTIRLIDGAGYAGSVVTHTVPIALIGLALTGATGSFAVLVLALLARLALKLGVDAATKAPGGRWWLLPVRDVLSFCVFVASFLVNSVGWRGQRFRVGSDGRLTPS